MKKIKKDNGSNKEKIIFEAEYFKKRPKFKTKGT